MLDAVLRRGRTLDSAAQAVKGLKPADLGLAVAIAGEVLRRMPDLDALIDGATRQRPPDDSKARMVLRIALAQKVALKSAYTIKLGKEAFYRQAEMNLADAYRYAAEVMTENMMARDAEEGIGAFLEKREPKWQDK